MNLGDRVEYVLEGHTDQAFVIGSMGYSLAVLLVATKEAHGMPIHRDLCKVIPGGDARLAKILLARYRKLYPKANVVDL